MPPSPTREARASGRRRALIGCALVLGAGAAAWFARAGGDLWTNEPAPEHLSLIHI